MPSDRWVPWSSETETPDKTVKEDGREHVAVLPQAMLRIVEGAEAGCEIVVGEGRVTVGRAPGNDLIVADPKVSAIHLELQSTDLGWALRDLDSTNGTFVGTTRVREVYVGPGAVIRVGNTTLRLDGLDRVETVPLSPGGRFGELMGSSVAMRRLFALLETVAASELTVLIQGETGTGKEEIARAIHASSRRAEGSFVVLDCSAIPQGLAEGIVFGHERGAFTGADRRQIGAFEAADGGTIFLDEVGELGTALQPKLLRVLETRQVTRLGESHSTPVDVRIVAATNRDLRRMVNEGSFRADLYYRLAQVPVSVAALRERPRDIEVLAEHFLIRASLRSRAGAGAPCRRFSAEALARLGRHGWPGNVRELKNLVERLAVLAPERLISDDLVAAELRESAFRPSLPVRPDLPYKQARAEVLRQFDAIYLAELHEHCGGNVTRGARQADLARHYLRRLFRKSGISYRS